MSSSLMSSHGWSSSQVCRPAALRALILDSRTLSRAARQAARRDEIAGREDGGNALLQ
jgi:hypothetical protein